jgi:hypothetical protein
MSESDKEVIDSFKELEDGSVIIGDVESNDDEIVDDEYKEGGSVKNAEPKEDDDDDDGEEGDGRDAIRETRREERRLKKEISRAKTRESNLLVNMLKKQNAELSNRLSQLEARTSGVELARVDKVIDDTAVQVEYAKLKMKESIASQDGDSLVRAQELLYESQRKLEHLKSLKDRAAQQATAKRQDINVPDPVVQDKAARWMKDNAWYDPQVRDQDSSIANAIDVALTREGYDPATQEYWDEMNDRIRQVLPHRAAGNQDQRQEQRQEQRRRSPVSGTGRESSTSGKKEIRLDKDRIKAMKDAGLWDDPVKRMQAAKSYLEYDRLNPKK